MTPSLSWSDLLGSSEFSAQTRGNALDAHAVDGTAQASGEPFLALPAALPASRRRYTFNGSAAIDAALHDIQLLSGARVLLPAYCGGAELGPFEHRGCQMSFYDVEPDASVRVERLEQRLQNQPDIQLVLVTHHNGIIQPEIETIAALCRSRGVALLEDCAHALFSELDGLAAGSWGDHAVFSMRKSLPLSEGGALTSRAPLQDASRQVTRLPSRIAQLSRVAWSFQQGARSGGHAGSAGPARLLTLMVWSLPSLLTTTVRLSGVIPDSCWLTPDVEGADAYPVYELGISGLSRRLLEHCDGRLVRERRRLHHTCWVNLVEDIAGVETVCPTLPEGACPLYFLLRVEDPAHCVEQLAMQDIEAFAWWHYLSPQIVWSQYPVARRLKQSLLALPLHQQLTEADIMHMATCLSAAVGEQWS